jgi:ribulose-5-phosphate 4-epimerase/fuculose-1-phosphate aldolase
MATKKVRETKQDRDLKQKLIVAGKVLVNAGQGDFTRGHISMRLPTNPKLFYMKPHSIGLDEITMANILTIDLAGNVVAGKARRHSEVFIHSEILKARSDINCVIHAHPTYSVALSASGHSVKAYSQPGALFYEDIGIYTDAIALIRSHEMGAGVAKALGSHRAAFLKAHGTAVAGKTIEETVISAIMLENAALIQMIVEAAGNPAPEFSRDEVFRLKREMSAPEQFVINFDYLARKVGGRK